MDLHMKIFFITLLTISVFLQSAYAISNKDKQQQQDSKKMEQLQQLLVRAAQSNISPPLPETGLPNSTTDMFDAKSSAQTDFQAPFAGLSSASSAVPPKPTSTSLLVDLSPKAVPPVIRLGAGYITSIVFVDTTGQPWPIAAYSIGDPSAFNIQWDRKGNTLLIQASAFYKRSNLAVILRDLNTPVMITLISGQEAVDYRV